MIDKAEIDRVTLESQQAAEAVAQHELHRQFANGINANGVHNMAEIKLVRETLTNEEYSDFIKPELKIRISAIEFIVNAFKTQKTN